MDAGCVLWRQLLMRRRRNWPPSFLCLSGAEPTASLPVHNIEGYGQWGHWHQAINVDGEGRKVLPDLPAGDTDRDEPFHLLFRPPRICAATPPPGSLITPLSGQVRRLLQAMRPGTIDWQSDTITIFPCLDRAFPCFPVPRSSGAALDK